MKHLTLKSLKYELVLKDFDEAIKTIGYNGRKESYYATNVLEFLYFLEQSRGEWTNVEPKCPIYRGFRALVVVWASNHLLKMAV